MCCVGLTAAECCVSDERARGCLSIIIHSALTSASSSTLTTTTKTTTTTTTTTTTAAAAAAAAADDDDDDNRFVLLLFQAYVTVSGADLRDCRPSSQLVVDSFTLSLVNLLW